MKFKCAIAGFACVLMLPLAHVWAQDRIYRATPETIHDGLARLQPGETLLLADGVYPKIHLKERHGAPDRPMTIRAENERRAFIKNNGDGVALSLVDCSWWVIEGLRIENDDNEETSSGAGIVLIGNSEHITFRRNLLARPNRWGNNIGLSVSGGSRFVLIEENELYDFHRNGISIHNAPGKTDTRYNIIRRNYVNSRETDYLGRRWGPNTGIVIYRGAHNIIENNIVEYAAGGSNGINTFGPGNRVLGNISTGTKHGFGVYLSGIAGDNTVMRNNLAYNVHEGQGFFGVSVSNLVLENNTAFNVPTNGFSMSHSRKEQRAEDFKPSVRIRNMLVFGAGNYGYRIEDAEEFEEISITHSYGWNNESTWGPGTEDVQRTEDLDPLLQPGVAPIWIPAKSPIQGRGEDGANLGASILYRYENGKLTHHPLWDPVTGAFPQGAIIAGVNDRPGESLFDVHERLGISPETLPADYRRPETITVADFTGRDIQAAIDQAVPGAIVYLPAGEYVVTEQIVVNKPLTLRGAAELQNVNNPDWNARSIPAEELPELEIAPRNPRWATMRELDETYPYWDGEPSVLRMHDYENWNREVPEDYPEDGPFRRIYVGDMIRVTADGVRMEDLEVVGPLRHQEDADYRQNGIFVQADDFHLDGALVRRHGQAITLGGHLARDVVIENSFIFENFRQGSGYGVRVSDGAQATIRNNTFSRNRHSVVGSGDETLMFVESNYFVNGDRVTGAHELDTHPAGNVRMVLRDNVLRHTMGVVYMSGNGEVTNNYFDDQVMEWSGGSIFRFGIGANDRGLRSSNSHNVYVGNNLIEDTPEPLSVHAAPYDDGRKWVIYNLYYDGVLHESANLEYPARDEDPSPLVGYMHVSEPDSDQRVDTIQRSKWYDLHVYAVDPQGAEDIATIGAQLVNRKRHGYVPTNERGAFEPAGNYFLESDGVKVRIRAEAGADTWSELRPGTACEHFDVSKASGLHRWEADTDHRIHFTVRFRLDEKAEPGRWHLHGYAQDRDGNLPHARAHLEQEGWAIEVE